MILTDEQRMLAEAARGFLDDNAPVAALRRLRDEGSEAGFDRGLWAEMAQMGWAGVLVAEESGGSGLGHVEAALIAEEMGKTLAASPFLSTAVIGATALAGRDEAAAIAAGELVAALAVDEGRKHDPSALATTAERRGNAWVLRGEKVMVAEGEAADLLLVAALGPDGPALFPVDPQAGGVERKRVAMIDSRQAARVRLEGAPSSGPLGAEGEEAALLARALDAGRSGLAAELSGLAQGAFGLTTAYLKERRQFGVPIGGFQALQHRSADLYTEIEVTRSAVLAGAAAMDDDPDGAALAVSVAKARAAETARKAVSEGVQMHGGVGMTDAFDIGLYMKRARVGAEWLGDYGFHAARVAAIRGF